jgi:hypothetical protein
MENNSEERQTNWRGIYAFTLILLVVLILLFSYISGLYG